MTHPTWISVHLFYHDDLNQAIVGWMHPLVSMLQEQRLIDRFFFIRYWQGGPHLRLRLLPTAGVAGASIRAIVERSSSTFVTGYPSTTTLPIDQYLRSTAQLTTWEYSEDRRLPFYPNNSLQAIPYQPEYERYGGHEAMPLVERHFHDSSVLVTEMLVQGTPRQQRIGASLTMVLLALMQWDATPSVLHEVFRFSYQRWMRMFGDDVARYEAQFEQQYRRQQHIQKLVASLLHIGSDAPDDQHGSFTTQWVASVSQLRQSLRQVVDQDTLAARLPTAFLADGKIARVERAGMYIMLACLHMHNNRLQVSLVEEAYLAFLLQRTLRELIDQSEASHRDQRGKEHASVAAPVA